MKLIIETFKETKKALAKQRERDTETKEKAIIAKTFNDRYTYRKRYNEDAGVLEGHSFFRGGFAWMCPECNKIHETTSWCPWSGLQFPRCCHTDEGHRGFEKIRAK